MAFCYLGYFTAKFAPIFRGMEPMLPVADRLIVACGPVVFPLLGVLAAFSFVLLDHYFRRQWTQWFLMALYLPIILWAFSSLVAPRFINGPSPRANHSIERMGASRSAQLVSVAQWRLAPTAHAGR